MQGKKSASNIRNGFSNTDRGAQRVISLAYFRGFPSDRFSKTKAISLNFKTTISCFQKLVDLASQIN